ncbi:hypothetical protein DPMN_036317 [Dreissena polymorpha]|uniref:Uncharacterized protein n=1 Tax=Dreissena polymorpha TaxID=45954 RepID=A0A9D4RLD0_DREPO|nr:hypothetical protein DPMN_036317 [Dreissena polymorpha]
MLHNDAGLGFETVGASGQPPSPWYLQRDQQGAHVSVDQHAVCALGWHSQL